MAIPGAAVIERAGLKAWPGVEVCWDGAWVRRAANGHTQRANSVQSLDPADDGGVARRIAAARRWYAERNLPAIFRITPLAPPALVAELDRQGWTTVSHSRLMAMELDTVEPEGRGAAVAVDDPGFLEAQRRLKGFSDEDLARFRAILSALEVPARGIVQYGTAGRIVSCALMAVADGIVVTGSVVTDPAERRKGYAAAMLRTGLAWAKQAGATVAALNVEAGNGPALALYEGLGYRARYDYVYRYPGAP